MSLLAVDNLSISFGGVDAVRGVSFDVNANEVFSLIGPNGAGKTTLFNLITAVYRPKSGRVRFNSSDITGHRPHELAALGIARTFQNIELFEHATVLHNLLIGRHARAKHSFWRDACFAPTVRTGELQHREAVERAIDFLALHAHRDSLVEGLPYGVRKVVELGRALCTEPTLLLLDEPSSGLNPEETDDMAFWITDLRDEMGITVVMIEHDMSLVARVSDRVLALNFGQVITTGSAAEVQRHPEVISAYLG